MNNFIYGVIVGLMLPTIISLFMHVDKSYMQRISIEHGCGEYNNTTGKFQWIDLNKSIR